MRILWVKANKILPLHSGGDIRSYHIARYLALQHELCFLSYYEGQCDPRYEEELGEHFPGACCINTGSAKSTAARVLDYLLRLADHAPYAVSRFTCKAVRQKLEVWFQQNRFDVAVCDFLDAAVNFPSAPGIPCVLFQHNVESEIWRRHATTEKNPLKRSVYSLELKKMAAYERTTVEAFPHTIAVSEHDRELMSAWIDPSRLSVVPTGVDLSEFKCDGFSGEPDPLVMFVGAMDWEPNIDAVQHFCHEIWPSVLAQFPQARLRIVGRNPDRRVQRFSGPTIEITGRVPTVINHLRQAAVIVVPLRIGGGTRLKIYEAMAAGKAIVSTSVGAEGLDVHHGRDIILADSPRTFADAVVMLLREPELRKRYERAAVESVAPHAWPAVGSRFQEVLESIAARNRIRLEYATSEMQSPGSRLA